MQKYIPHLAIVIVAFFLSVILFFLGLRFRQAPVSYNSPETVSVSPSSLFTNDPVSWPRYENSKYKYVLPYPFSGRVALYDPILKGYLPVGNDANRVGLYLSDNPYVDFMEVQIVKQRDTRFGLNQFAEEVSAKNRRSNTLGPLMSSGKGSHPTIFFSYSTDILESELATLQLQNRQNIKVVMLNKDTYFYIFYFTDTPKLEKVFEQIMI